MKILQIRSGFEDNGPGSQSLTIATELRNRGHSVEFAASDCVMINQIEKSEFIFNKLDSLSRNKRNIFTFIQSIILLRKLIKNKSIDIVHAHNAASAITVFIACISIRKKIKVFHSVRGIELRTELRYRWRNWIYRFYPMHIFAVSQFTKNELIALGVNKKNITVTYNGVNLKKFSLANADENKIKNEFNIPHENIIIGHVGAMSTNTKGQHILINSFARLVKEYSNITLICVGDGKSKSSFEALVKELDLGNEVIFTGRRFDIPDMQAAFDIFCLNSIWGEMFPNAILEAMSMGNPWVGSDISGLPELTADNKAGVVVPPGDIDALYEELKTLIISKEERDRRGSFAHKEVLNRFTISKVVDRIEKAYSQ
jgi:glycosyltransferase involved in cell wall biosynthesis